MTMPPQPKPLSELKAAMLQFRSILRISNVSVKDFLDSIVFKDKRNSITYSEFKVRIEGILKNHTSDFASYWFQGAPIKNKEQLETTLKHPNVFFELEDYLDERLEIELKTCKITLKEALEIEDTKSTGFISLKQYEEVLENLDIHFDRGKS